MQKNLTKKKKGKKIQKQNSVTKSSCIENFVKNKKIYRYIRPIKAMTENLNKPIKTQKLFFIFIFFLDEKYFVSTTSHYL